MTARASRPPRTPSQRWFGILLAVLAVLLPGLAAGAGIEGEASDAERERLRAGLAAVAAPDEPATLAAHVLYAATANDQAASRLATAPQATVIGARFGMVWLLVAIGALLYLLMSVSRGGMTALLSCLVLSTLPPVVEDGFVLRPEPLACAFGLLATVLLAAYALVVLVRRRRPTWRRALFLVGMAALVGAAYGVAAAALSRASVLMLIPAGIVTLACVVQTWTWWRLWRRRRLSRRMLFGLARRSWAWFCLAAVGMASSSLVLFWLSAHGVEVTAPTASAFGYLPLQWPRAAVVGILMAIGGLRLLMDSGGHLSARQLHPSLVLLLFCALALMQHSMYGSGHNALLAACAAAALAGEGAATAIVVLVGVLLMHAQRRRRQTESGAR